MSNRGFEELIGKTIVEVNTDAINVVILKDSDELKYEIDSEPGPLGIPVLTLARKYAVNTPLTLSMAAGLYLQYITDGFTKASPPGAWHSLSSDEQHGWINKALELMRTGNSDGTASFSFSE